MSPSDLAELTLELCRIPSVTGDEAAIASWVEARLRASTMDVARHGNSVVARSRGGRDPEVVLLGHLDTVPPKAGDPAPRIEGDLVLGLGASDMKGGLAVMLALAARASSSARPFGLVFYDKEEGPWAESGLGPVLDAVRWLHGATLCFCLEPSDNVVQVGCLGTLHARVAIPGKAAHSARPWQGQNAVHAAGPLLIALAARAPVEVTIDGHRFVEVISATLAAGGVSRNTIPDRFELNLNYRYAPGRDAADAAAEVTRYVHAAVPSAEVTIAENAPSGRVVTANPLLRAFLEQNRNAVAAKQAWTDVARLSAAGIDAVNLGPGLSSQAHQAREQAGAHLLAESFAQFARFLGMET
jgi:succinyl-diaminopimelate desuccinylase